MACSVEHLVFALEAYKFLAFEQIIVSSFLTDTFDDTSYLVFVKVSEVLNICNSHHRNVHCNSDIIASIDSVGCSYHSAKPANHHGGGEWCS